MISVRFLVWNVMLCSLVDRYQCAGAACKPNYRNATPMEAKISVKCSWEHHMSTRCRIYHGGDSMITCLPQSALIKVCLTLNWSLSWCWRAYNYMGQCRSLCIALCSSLYKSVSLVSWWVGVGKYRVIACRVDGYCTNCRCVS